MIKFSSALVALASVLLHVEGFTTTHHNLDRLLARRVSERRYSSAVETRSEVEAPDRTVSVENPDILKLERQFKALASTKKPSRKPSPLDTAVRSRTPTPVQQLEPPRRDSNTPRSKAGLSRHEEIEYSYKIRTFRAAVRLRDQLAAEGGPIDEATWAQACGCSIMNLRRVLHEGQEARAALVGANVGLVTSIAKRHYYSLKQAMDGGVGTILTLQDMVQEGNLGLMEAAERYEPERGFRFSTYATWWVRQRILRSISDSSRTIRLPAHVHSMLQKMRKAKRDIKTELGREPTANELASHLDVSEEKLQLYEDSSRNVLSLERPLRTGGTLKDDSRTLGDIVASDAPTPEEDAEADYLRRDIRAVMDTALADKEREVIVKRFGLDNGRPRTVKETAELLDISRDRVRLVEARALNKLRHPQRNYKLKEYIGEATRDYGGISSSREPAGAFSDREDQEKGNPKSDRIWFF